MIIPLLSKETIHIFATGYISTVALVCFCERENADILISELEFRRELKNERLDFLGECTPLHCELASGCSFYLKFSNSDEDLSSPKQLVSIKFETVDAPTLTPVLSAADGKSGETVWRQPVEIPVGGKLERATLVYSRDKCYVSR